MDDSSLSLKQPDRTARDSRRHFLLSAARISALLAFGNLHSVATADNEIKESGALRANGRASATAQGAALLRAAHQLLDERPVFVDPLALKIIGQEAAQALHFDPKRFAKARSRAFIALRSRYAEDRLSAAVGEGVEQYVVLGAGLDTFAYRNPHPNVHVFEVDHPATQVWKQQRLAEAGITMPESVTFVPIDFETQTLAQALRLAGFKEDEPGFFSLLGVAIYITRPALMDTLHFVAGCKPGSGITFSYSIPWNMLSDTERRARARRARRVAALGEPWISYYDSAALSAELESMGFSEVEDLGPAEANARYFSERTDGLRVSGSSRMMAGRV